MGIHHLVVRKIPYQLVIAVNLVNRMMHIADNMFYFLLNSQLKGFLSNPMVSRAPENAVKYTGSGKTLYIYHFIVPAFSYKQ